MGFICLRRYFQSWYSRLGAWGGPVLILLLAVLTYLPMLWQLGYYRDDWHVAWAGSLFGPGKIIDLHLTDRPVMGVIYSLAYRFVGDSPVSWQVYALALRVAGALLFYWLLLLIWPAQRQKAALMGVFFVLYPGFLQMPTASAYSNHLFGLAMGILSIALTILAVKMSRSWSKALLVVASVITGLACYSVMEYMISMEAVRIILLGYLSFRENSSRNASHILRPVNLRRLLWQWLPNLASLAIFLVWRVFFFKSARSVTNVGALARGYLEEPGLMLARLIIETIKGMFNALVLAWGVPFYNLFMNASYLDLLASALLALLVILIALLFFRGVGAISQEQQGSTDKNWQGDAIWLGLLIAVVNLVPIVLANRNIRLTDTFDRYTLPASLGVVMVVVGLVARLRPRMQVVAIAVLLWVCVLTHYHNTAYFRNFWEYQRQLWWQLSWRAPGLKQDTVLIPALPPGYALAESYEIWGPANLIYGTPEDPLVVSGESLNNDTVLSVISQQNFDRGVRRVEVSLDFKNTLVVSLPSPDSCVHVMDSNWREMGDAESTLVRLVAPFSRVDLIDPWAEARTPPAVIFGREPVHGWCYYYQKASLARQKEDWQEVVRLGDEVRSKGLRPNHALEWMPFYQGYAYASQFETANEVAHDLRGDRLSLQTFCAQFSQEQMSRLRPGSTDEFILLNICPEEWLVGR